MPWARSCRSSPGTPSIISLGACPDTVNHAYKHVWSVPTAEYHSALSAKWTSLPHHCFTLISRVSLNLVLCRLIIFISIKWCGILSFLAHYPVPVSVDMSRIFSPSTSDLFIYLRTPNTTADSWIYLNFSNLKTLSCKFAPSLHFTYCLLFVFVYCRRKKMKMGQNLTPIRKLTSPSQQQEVEINLTDVTCVEKPLLGSGILKHISWSTRELSSSYVSSVESLSLEWVS